MVKGQSVAGTEAPGLSLQVITLNGFRVVRAGQVIPESAWSRAKVTLLFKYLLVQKGLAVPQGQILSLFWPHLELKAARHNFAVTLYSLRRVLGEGKGTKDTPSFIVYERGLCRFNIDLPHYYDVQEFEHLAETGLTALRSEKAEIARASLRAARTLYRTDFLIENQSETWIAAERERLRELYLRVLEGLASACLALKEFPEAAECAGDLLKQDPCREETYRILIRALVASGKRTEALRCYHFCQKMLAQEFGLEPAPETRRLYDRIVNAEA